MSKANLVGSISIILALLVAACGGGDDGATNSDGTSEFNPDLEGDITSGEPGGDISRIAGLWNGSTNNASGSDVVYWHLAANGVLTRYDYQQDSGSAASGENCYVVDNPITVTPESDDDYSIQNVAVTAVVNDDSLIVTFLEADRNDLDNDGNTNETPEFTWTRLLSPVLED